MSMLSSTPFAAMSSNTSKMKGLLTDAGIPRFLTDDPSAAFRSIDEWKEADKIAVRDYVQKARRDALAMFVDIASVR